MIVQVADCSPRAAGVVVEDEAARAPAQLPLDALEADVRGGLVWRASHE